MKTHIDLVKAYKQMTELMSLKQFTQIMAGDMTYKSKAERAKKTTKSKKILALADEVIAIATQLGY